MKLIEYIVSLFSKKQKKNKEKNYPDVCNYSGLPSVSSYVEERESRMPDFIDYDGMGNHGRFPKRKKND
jgi:hypothetical protein